MASKPRTKVAVIGSGLVGRGWAIVFASAGFDVAIYDADKDAITRAIGGIKKSLKDLKKYGLVREPAHVLARISPQPDLVQALAGAEYAQESVPEKLDIKQSVFAQLDELASPDTILATSSSGLTASAIAKNLKGRERCLVVHPLNPPQIVPLVEIVPAPWTSPAVVSKARSFMERAGKIPIVLKSEVAGFIVNRLQGAVLHEAFALVEDGCVSAQDIDAAMTHGLGLRWSVVGPFETIDLGAPKGVTDYAERYGKMYLGFANERGSPKPWSKDVVDDVEKEMRTALSLSEIPNRQGWRDRRLMGLVAHNKKDSKGAARR